MPQRQQPLVSTQPRTEHVPLHSPAPTHRHHATTQRILAADVPAAVWNGSAVLRELGQHPDTPSTQAHIDGHVDGVLDVSILFGYSAINIKAATDFVERGHIRPASVRILSRLCLTTVAAMNMLGGDRSLHYSFRAVIRRHLEQNGPRTGVWEHVHDTTALVGGDVSGLKCKAWSSELWTVDLGTWLQRMPLRALCHKEWWWLVKQALKVRTHDLQDRTAALERYG